MNALTVEVLTQVEASGGDLALFLCLALPSTISLFLVTTLQRSGLIWQYSAYYKLNLRAGHVHFGREHFAAQSWTVFEYSLKRRSFDKVV